MMDEIPVLLVPRKLEWRKKFAHRIFLNVIPVLDLAQRRTNTGIFDDEGVMIDKIPVLLRALQTGMTLW